MGEQSRLEEKSASAGEMVGTGVAITGHSLCFSWLPTLA